MRTDRHTLNLIAAVLCGVGSLASLVAAMLSGGPRNATARAAMLSGLLGTVGSAAWAVAAHQDRQDARDRLDQA